LCNFETGCGGLIRRLGTSMTFMLGRFGSGVGKKASIMMGTVAEKFRLDGDAFYAY
jgi:hypothetical protein